jgi:hypothetical protein
LGDGFEELEAPCESVLKAPFCPGRKVRESMRTTLRDLADARKELLEIQQEFGRLQKRIDAVRDCVTNSLTRIFGEERPSIAALAEEELIEFTIIKLKCHLIGNGNRF